MGEVDVISTDTVRMTNPNEGISRVELTPWDLRILLLDQIQRGLLFYRPEYHGEKQDFEKTFVLRLKNSLSLALDLFPPLAGRLAMAANNNTTASFFVDCNNAGALFTHAIARGVHVRDILDPIYTPAIVQSLFAFNRVPNCGGISKPLLGVQVTELVDGYFVGCTANHTVVDGTTFWHFFNSWSDISRTSSPSITKLPVFDRPFHDMMSFPIQVNNPPMGIITNPHIPNDPPLILERFFRFDKENVSKLKARANSEAADNNTNKISSLQAVVAHLWRAVGRASYPPAGQHNVSFTFMIGVRARLPLPDTYFGNCADTGIVVLKSEDLVQKGLGWVALELNKIVTSRTREEAKRVFEETTKNLAIYPIDQMPVDNKHILIGSSPRYPVYATDFGWGKPVAVRSGPAQKYDGMIYVFPAPEPGGGIDVEVCLAPETMVAIGEDAEFMEAVTAAAI